MKREESPHSRGAGSPAPRRRSWVRRFAARAGWLVPAALAMLVPKCPLCLVAYLGAATGLGFVGKEICGLPPSSPTSWVAPAGIALALAVGIFWAWRIRHSRTLARTEKQPAR
ncbi:MAG TPA: hypothetical protein VFB27_02125 [Opitutaceae bacterium]|nr:hypothetical protein [Opitutaceae bacterium]